MASSLDRGVALAHYRILSALGAGGMGEVYEALDERLDRAVALKVLPPEFVQNEERVRRFVLEAKSASGLNHPHIVTIYDIGHADPEPKDSADPSTPGKPVHYIAMEIVRGLSLRDKIHGEKAPLKELVRWLAQVAEGMAKAHAAGIVHRDLKPENVMISNDSFAKILDFGLAKLTEGKTPAEGGASMATAVRNTHEGAVMGTVGYMSPEQVQGRVVDARSDIFSFGCMLYEATTRQRAFDANSQIETMHQIINAAPVPVAELNPDAPAELRKMIRRCLAKDPERRYQSMKDLSLELFDMVEEFDELSTSASSRSGAPTAVVSGRRNRERIALAAAATLAVALAATGIIALRQPPHSTPVLRVSLPAKTSQYSRAGLRLPSPDGTFVIFQARDANDIWRIWRQGIADPQATPIDGTENGSPGQISPNGRSFLMYRAGKLFRIDFAGGSPVMLAEMPEDWGLTWLDDSTVIYANSIDRGLWRVSSAGGKPEKLLGPESESHYLIWPEALPGGRTVLYLESALLDGGNYNKRLTALDMTTMKRQFIAGMATRTLYADGRLLSVREGSLVAVPFDSRTLRITGEPRILADHVANFSPRGSASIAVSMSGLLTYDSPSSDRSLRWIDREGRALGELAPTAGFTSPSISPDGSHVAVAVIDPKNGVPNIWLYGVARPTRERLAFSDRYENNAVWTRDQRWIIYHSDRSDVPDLYRRPADGNGTEELLYEAPGLQTPTDVSPDGRWLAFTNSLTGTTGMDIMLLSLDEKKARPWLQTPADERDAGFSQDGRWLAYTSDESGKSEVYVRPFPGPGEKFQISTGGGFLPRWSPDGGELLYISNRTVMAVDVRGDTFAVNEPRRLFSSDEQIDWWEIAPDGRILLLTIPEELRLRPSHLIVNWPGLVK